ncbi:hypothetical protein T069G_02260 [Trichoderma breve]|uniref:Rhodopsin domain-containing protein n=1 Tax=Trichoderma breve TaxID=2034170 RepID=A0A9W9EA22_9HYPO|nr:hypothetical protein T069G_02260 [Trichoderma breve]KAJ4861306.1 hypothetical protein T069G_02260 [Trichoderma breve]
MTRTPPPDPLPPNRNIGITLIVVTSILTGFMLLTTSLRIYTRFSLNAQGLDDYCIIIVSVLALARMAIQVVQVAVYHNGRHRWYISESDYINNNMLGWDEPKVRRTLYAVVIGLFATNFGSIFILVAECSPPSVYWTQKGGKCWDTRIRIYAIYLTIAYSVATDILCSLLPLYVVWGVGIKMHTKIAVCGLMSLGLLATAFGVARAASLGLVTIDLSWDYAISAIWSNLELFLGIIAANVAISHSIYTFFRQDKSAASVSGYSSANIRLGYLKHDELRNNTTSNSTLAIIRRPSVSKSEGSEAPLTAMPYTVASSSALDKLDKFA